MSVSKIINKIVFSDVEPDNPYVIWMVKDGAHYNFRYFQDGIWEPILVTKEELEALVEQNLDIQHIIEETYNNIQDITQDVMDVIPFKADLIDGKVPEEQLPPLPTPDLSPYLQKSEAEEIYATLEQAGQIDLVLDILNGDIEGDLDLILSEISGI